MVLKADPEIIPKTMDENSSAVSQDKSSLFLKCSSQALVTVMTSKVNANSISFP